MLSETLSYNLIIVLVLMVGLWLISLWRRDASNVDPFWGFGFVVVAWVSVVMNLPTSFRMILLATLATVWGLRLSLYLLWRNWGHGEDSRYVAMRTKHGDRFWWISLFTVFLMQGAILWFVSLPIQVAAGVTQKSFAIGWLDGVGVVFWGIGLFFESVGDWQLARFKSNPANQGEVLDTGLWRYTRHPNYFGDFCVWWGIYLISIGAGGVWTIASPLLMSLFLMKVSGVTLLEKTISGRRPKYVDYIRRTNAFFPGAPRGE